MALNPLTIGTVLALFVAGVPLVGHASGRKAAEAPVNASILRSASGTIAYRVRSTGAVTGYEHWRLTVHPDGSRTMVSSVQYTPRDVQRHVVQRVGPRFEPLETYALYWIGGQWRGSAMATVRDRQLSVVANTALGAPSQRFALTGPIAIVPHVLAADTWRVMLYDRSRGGTQPIEAYNFDAMAEGPQALLGRLMSYRITHLGPATIRVRAGRFETEKFLVEDAVHLYVSGEDGMLVKFVYPSIDREHELIEYRAGEPVPSRRQMAVKQ